MGAMTALPVRGGRSRARAPVLLTLVSALLYAAAFPPLGLYPLAWIALAPFLWALGRVGPLAAAGLGLLWSVVLGLGTAYALPGMISGYFETSAALGWAGLVATSLVLSGSYLAPVSAWLSWQSRRAGIHPFAFAAAWGGYEYARAHLLVPSPWALTAYSQLPATAFVQSADVVGAFGLGMLIAAGNACVASLLDARLRPRRPAVAWLAVLVLCAGALGYGAWRLGEPLDPGREIDVALVQSGVEPHWRSEQAHRYRDANLDRHLQLTASAIDSQPDLVLWPEFAVDFFLRERTEERQRLLGATRASGAELLLGAPDYRYRLSGPEYFNAAFLLRGGVLVDRHRKVQLMPFSEENPLREVVAIGSDRYTRGEEARPLRSRHAAIGVLLCSEVIHPGHVRELVRAGAQLLANPSNDDWLGSGGAARQLLDAVSMRAIENRRWVVRSSVNGYTGVIDPHGRLRGVVPAAEPAVLLAQVRASDVTTPYQRFGDVAPQLAVAALALFSLHPLAARRRTTQRRLS
jgi:apolipoprotein N-acyltransferase